MFGDPAPEFVERDIGTSPDLLPDAVGKLRPYPPLRSMSPLPNALSKPALQLLLANLAHILEAYRIALGK